VSPERKLAPHDRCEKAFLEEMQRKARARGRKTSLSPAPLLSRFLFTPPSSSRFVSAAPETSASARGALPPTTTTVRGPTRLLSWAKRGPSRDEKKPANAPHPLLLERDAKGSPRCTRGPRARARMCEGSRPFAPHPVFLLLKCAGDPWPGDQKMRAKEKTVLARTATGEIGWNDDSFAFAKSTVFCLPAFYSHSSSPHFWKNELRKQSDPTPAAAVRKGGLNGLVGGVR